MKCISKHRLTCQCNKKPGYNNRVLVSLLIAELIMQSQSRKNGRDFNRLRQFQHQRLLLSAY
jgi:hypothetical protein